MDLPAPLSGTVSERGGGWRHIVNEELARCAERRDRVLAHPDLAQQLCDHPLKIADPTRWNGYVPPEMWQTQRNDSPYRAQIMRVLQAVAEREEAEAG